MPDTLAGKTGKGEQGRVVGGRGGRPSLVRHAVAPMRGLRCGNRLLCGERDERRARGGRKWWMVLLSQQRGGERRGGADSCALSADVNCLDVRHKAKRAPGCQQIKKMRVNGKKKKKIRQTGERGQAGTVQPPTSQPVLCVTKRIQDK